MSDQLLRLAADRIVRETYETHHTPSSESGPEEWDFTLSAPSIGAVEQVIEALAANVRVGDAGLDVERLAAAIHLGKRHNALSCQHIEDRSDAAAIAREYAALAEPKP